MHWSVYYTDTLLYNSSTKGLTRRWLKAQEPLHGSPCGFNRLFGSPFVWNLRPNAPLPPFISLFILRPSSPLGVCQATGMRMKPQRFILFIWESAIKCHLNLSLGRAEGFCGAVRERAGKSGFLKGSEWTPI